MSSCFDIPLYFSYCTSDDVQEVIENYRNAGYKCSSVLSSDYPYALGVFTTVEGNVVITDSLEGLNDYIICEIPPSFN